VKGKRLVHLGSVVGAVNTNYYFVIIYAVFVTPKFFNLFRIMMIIISRYEVNAVLCVVIVYTVRY
jgi:hypothetical protein